MILQAFLDLSDHPAWVTDGEGTLVMNVKAKELTQQGLTLARLCDASPGHAAYSHALRGASLTKRDLNHGTGCTLYELKHMEEPTRRVRESAIRLAAALEQYK